MFRTVVLAASLALAAFMSEAAFAGQPAVAGTLSANGATASPATSAAASADKVYPPLPTLAMLPPSAGDEDEPLAAPKPASKKRKARAPVDVRPTAPAARLVVSDTTRTYLRSVEKQLDLALAK
ncbi:MAG TPA: hypothetical protein VN289_16530 [Paraburkholderia sp.]|jgi:hypothetical protein|nr:hypothetical protein [Paraburkholderia sp.]